MTKTKIIFFAIFLAIIGATIVNGQTSTTTQAEVMDVLSGTTSNPITAVIKIQDPTTKKWFFASLTEIKNHVRSLENFYLTRYLSEILRNLRIQGATSYSESMISNLVTVNNRLKTKAEQDRKIISELENKKIETKQMSNFLGQIDQKIQRSEKDLAKISEQTQKLTGASNTKADVIEIKKSVRNVIINIRETHRDLVQLNEMIDETTKENKFDIL